MGKHVGKRVGRHMATWMDGKTDRQVKVGLRAASSSLKLQIKKEGNKINGKI